MGKVPLDKITILAGFLFLIIMSIFFTLFKAVIKPSDSAKRILEEKHEKKVQEKHIKKQRRKERIDKIKERMVESFNLLKGRPPKL